jgi:hypothetical protein
MFMMMVFCGVTPCSLAHGHQITLRHIPGDGTALRSSDLKQVIMWSIQTY